MSNLFRETSAVFSSCGRYRYKLVRKFSPGSNTINFLMLNPSTADDIDNDPTVERCERRASRLGFDILIVTNIFAWRDTDPRKMKQAEDPVGPDNDCWIQKAASESDMIVCAWGNNGLHRGRCNDVVKLIEGYPLYCLKETSGQPHHPLYLPYNLEPKRWK